MNSVLKTRPELAGRSVEAILRPMAYQTLEGDRRGGLAARERREELSDPVPVLCDPIEVTRNLLAYKFARFWALPFIGCWASSPAGTMRTRIRILKGHPPPEPAQHTDDEWPR